MDSVVTAVKLSSLVTVDKVETEVTVENLSTVALAVTLVTEAMVVTLSRAVKPELVVMEATEENPSSHGVSQAKAVTVVPVAIQTVAAEVAKVVEVARAVTSSESGTTAGNAK